MTEYKKIDTKALRQLIEEDDNFTETLPEEVIIIMQVTKRIEKEKLEYAKRKENEIKAEQKQTENLNPIPNNQVPQDRSYNMVTIDGREVDFYEFIESVRQKDLETSERIEHETQEIEKDYTIF
jgi:hypothetical protein